MPAFWNLTRLAAAALLLGNMAGTALADPLKIRLPWAVPVASWGSILLEKKDLMKNLGNSYTLETIRFKGSPEMITALAAGDIDIADIGFGTFSNAIANGGMTDLRIIADEIQDGVQGYYTQEFFVHKDSNINSVQDLKGKVLASSSIGAASDMAMRAMLRKNGIDDRKDVKIVEAPFSTMGAMLTSKKADLVVGVRPFSADPEMRNAGRVLFDTRDAMGGVSQLVIWVAREKFLKENRAAMVDFMEDVQRVVRWYVDPANHDEAVAIITNVTKTPDSIWKEWVFTEKDYYRDPNMKPNLEALQANLDTQLDLGFLKKRIEVGPYADLSIVEEAAARLK